MVVWLVPENQIGGRDYVAGELVGTDRAVLQFTSSSTDSAFQVFQSSAQTPDNSIPALRGARFSSYQLFEASRQPHHPLPIRLIGGTGGTETVA